MSTRVVHFGEDQSGVVTTLRQDGYQVDETGTSIERLNLTIKDCAPDALVVSEHLDIVPIQILSSIVHETPLVPRILFQDRATESSPTFFDLVIPTSCPSLNWLPKVRNLIEKSSALRCERKALKSKREELLSSSRLLRSESARVIRESARAQFRARIEVECSQLQREGFLPTWDNPRLWPAPRQAGWARTLIVDDHCAFRQTLVHLLQGYITTLIIDEAGDGSEAVRKAEALEPDLILLDIGLPRLNGFEVARRVRQTVQNAKIIFITALSDVEFVNAAFDAGAAGYLTKDHVARDLRPAIESVLGGRRFTSDVS